MKKKLILAAVVLFSAFNANADGLGFSTDQGGEKPNPESPCVVVTCLYGKLTGNSQNECDPAVNFFKDIKGTKKHGIFDPIKTLRKRTEFLNGCPSADKDIVKTILKAFGKLKSI